LNEPLFTSALFGVASALSWGAGDFCGGLATRKSNALVVVQFSQLIGLALLIMLALTTHEQLPAPADVVWGALAGVAGLAGLAALYSALSRGNMGLVAPVTGVISTAMPVIFGALSQGWPHPSQILGFALAIAAVAFISTSGDTTASTHGLGLALIAGVSFGAFLILIAQARHSSVFWPLSVARLAALIVLTTYLLVRRRVTVPAAGAVPFIFGSGILDAGGNFLYVLAAQAGRVDVAGALSSMYPASTVLLALTLLHERLRPWQWAGVLLSLAAIPLIVGV